ncbi:MAG: DUF1062 domain-containing protein [Clostridium sp.]|nr:DUF1062 domain-containing protein [Clostridium sp.]
MSYLNKYVWEIVPENLPMVKRNCPKCNEKTHFINSEKFRVNANKNNLDVWLIYQCERCKSTYNMTIYERVKPSDLNKVEYEKLLANDKELAFEYGFDFRMFSKNKAEVIVDKIRYKVKEKKFSACYVNKDQCVIEIVCKYPIDIRVDKLLCEKLQVSRSKIKKLHDKGIIVIDNDKNSLSCKVKDGMEIHILKIQENTLLKEEIV